MQNSSLSRVIFSDKRLDQLYAKQFSALMEMFSICTIQFGRHHPHEANEYLKYD